MLGFARNHFFDFLDFPGYAVFTTLAGVTAIEAMLGESASPDIPLFAPRMALNETEDVETSTEKNIH